MDDDTPATPPDGTTIPQATAVLNRAILMLGARQTADIWISTVMLAQGTLLMLVIWFATLSVYWKVPPLSYLIVASIGLAFSVGGMVGGMVLWQRAEQRARQHGV